MLRIATILVLLALAPFARAQQDDVVVHARQLAESGRRVEALRVLEMRMLEHPGDVDAQLLHATILSWDRQFDRARQELEVILAKEPRNLDARLALQNVELWSGNTVRAGELARETVAMFPGNRSLAILSPRAAVRSNEVQVGGRYESFEHSDDWREAQLALKHTTTWGAFIGRASQARRFDRSDSQLELEAYPRLGKRAYLYAAAAASSEHTLYPRIRLGAELFATLAGGWEASAGYRWLDFHPAVDLYTASVNKYAGNWLFTVRGYDTKDKGSSLFGSARRYFGDGDEYVGLRAGRGSTRDEIRSTTDVESLEVREIAFESRVNVAPRLALELRGGVGNEETAQSRRSRRVSLGALLGWRF